MRRERTLGKLIQLELKKNRLSTMILTMIVITFSILGFMILIGFIEKMEGLQAFNDYEEALTIIDTLIRVVFIIYASVLVAKFVISEYKNKTITILFSYPISRKKLFAAKLTIIFIFTLGSILIANLIATASFLFVSEQFELLSGSPTKELIYRHTMNVLLQAVASAGISLIPIFFGMLRKSVPTTIISSILIVTVFSSHNNGFSLSSIIAIPISLACIGIFIAWLSIRQVNNADVM